MYTIFEKPGICVLCERNIEKLTVPVQGTLKSLGVVDGVNIFKLELSLIEQWVGVFEHVDSSVRVMISPVEGCAVVYQGDTWALMTLGKHAIYSKRCLTLPATIGRPQAYYRSPHGEYAGDNIQSLLEVSGGLQHPDICKQFNNYIANNAHFPNGTTSYTVFNNGGNKPISAGELLSLGIIRPDRDGPAVPEIPPISPVFSSMIFGLVNSGSGSMENKVGYLTFDLENNVWCVKDFVCEPLEIGCAVDAMGRVIYEKFKDHCHRRIVYDEIGGGYTELRFDRNYRVTSCTAMDGGDETTCGVVGDSWIYDITGNIIHWSNSDGASATIKYYPTKFSFIKTIELGDNINSAGVTEIPEPPKVITSAVYNTDGTISSQRKYGSGTINYFYNKRGLLKRMEGPNRYWEEWGYNRKGQNTDWKDSRGQWKHWNYGDGEEIIYTDSFSFHLESSTNIN